MSKSNQWAVGDRVLCVLNHGEYIIDGFGCCPQCGMPTIYLVGCNEKSTISHKSAFGINGCGFVGTIVEREHYDRRMFIRPDLDSLTNYKEQVSVRELAIPRELKNLETLKNN